MNASARGERGRAPLLLVGALAVIAIVAIAFVAFRRPAPPPAAPAAISHTPDGTITLDDRAAREAGLVVEAAKSITRRDELEAPAVVALDERHTARVGSMVEGKVVEVSAEIGDRVSSGTVLAQMQSTVVHDAWAGYRKAVADRRRLQNELKLATQNDERAARLFADKAVSEQDVQRAQANRVAAEEGLNIAETEVRRSEEELEHLGVTNSEDPTGESGEQIPVKAPLTGVVIDRLVTPGTAVTPGTPLFVVSDLSSLWVLAEIDETALPHVQAGRPVTVRVSAYPDEQFTGTIAWVADLINPKTRRVTVRCTVPNPQTRLKPEMYATVQLGESEPRAIVAVPLPAVQEIEGKSMVFVEEAKGRYKRRDVVLGADVEGWIEVRAGLRATERVVTTGAFLLKSELLKQTTPEG